MPSFDDEFILDSMAIYKPTLDEMTKSTENINQDITKIGLCISKTNKQLEQQQNAGQFSPSVALALAGSLAEALTPISVNYAEHADIFLSSVNKAERVLSPLVKYWLESGSDEKEIESFEIMIQSTEDARVNVQHFKERIQPAKRLSRSLFKIMQSIESSTSVCLAAMDVVIGWKELLGNRG